MRADGSTKAAPGDCPGPEMLRSFALGSLAEDEIEAVGTHLADCPTCQTALLSLDPTCDSFVEYLRDYDESLCHEQGYQDLCRRLAESTNTLDSGAQPSAPRSRSSVGLRVDTAAPEQLGNYQLIEKLGQGAMGTVYRAWHTKLKRTVAVKVLSPKRLDDPHVVERFAREMEALGKLDDHPHVIRARDAGESDSHHYLVMDYVDGIDLGLLLLRTGPLGVADACEVARQAALGLAHAHQRGLLHRDVKPSNLMLTRTGRVQVLDLGLASVRGDSEIEDVIVGTADYMAPEQWVNNAQLDVGVDAYGLGCTLYKLLVGHAPFAKSAVSPRAKRRAHQNSHPPAVSQTRSDIPPELDELVRGMLAKRPSRRFSKASEIADALAPFSEGADIAALANSVLGASDDTRRNLRDATLAQRIFGPLTLVQTSRRRWLAGVMGMCGLLAVGGWGARRFFGSMPYELLAAISSQHVHSEYDRKLDLLESHSTGQVLYRVPDEKHASYALSTRLGLLDRDVEVGLFFGYYEKSEKDYFSRQFEVIGVRASEEKGTIGMFRRKCAIFDQGENTSWTWDDIVEIDVPIVKAHMINIDELKIVVQDGQLVQVFLEGEEIKPLMGPDFDHDSPPGRVFLRPPLPANPCGIYHTEGTCYFRHTRLEPL